MSPTGTSTFRLPASASQYAVYPAVWVTGAAAVLLPIVALVDPSAFAILLAAYVAVLATALVGHRMGTIVSSERLPDSAKLWAPLVRVALGGVARLLLVFALVALAAGALPVKLADSSRLPLVLVVCPLYFALLVGEVVRVASQTKSQP